MLPIVVLVSGNGSNLQAIIDAVRTQHLAVHIRAVISNRADAYGLERARQANIPAVFLDSQTFNTRDEYDHALSECIAEYQPALIVLAGWMRILTTSFIRRWRPNILNIHPSLLPKYPGLHTHEQVLQNGDHEHGCTIHIVTEDLDAGPILAQSALAVEPNETIESLKQRVHRLEHHLYPLVIRWYADKRIQVTDHGIYFDGKLFSSPIFYKV